jgi:hypothetical protein
MAIKRKMTLASPVVKGSFETITGFGVNYIYVGDDTLTVFLNPQGMPSITFNMDGSGAVVSKGNVLLNPTQTTKVTNFIQAIEDACKANLELPGNLPE